MKQVKEILIPTFVLTVIACLVAALLAFTYNVTGIADLGTGLSDDELVEYASVLPDCDKLVQVDYTSSEADLLGVYTDESRNGMALHIQTAGYAGKSKPIEALVSFDANGTILKVVIVANQETPGLGSKITDEAYLANYEGISQSADSVATITGATISSSALKNGVNFAFSQFELLKGEVLA